MHVKIMKFNVEHYVVRRVIIGLEKNSFLIAAVVLVAGAGNLGCKLNFYITRVHLVFPQLSHLYARVDCN